MKCETCQQELPIATLTLGMIVDVSNDGDPAMWAGLAVVHDLIGMLPEVVFITGLHAGREMWVARKRLTIVHGYIHIDPPGKQRTIGDDKMHHKY